MSRIKALDKTTIRSIHSGQVITTLDAIVKELLENSLDANANSIDIKIYDDGLLKIEVRDNGSGIPLTDRCNMAKQHYTSKLATFTDLERMTTYGFRGEALSALCEVSGEVFITTKTKQDSVATCYKLDRNGSIISESSSGSISHTGTLVSIYQPFIHLPVRRQVAIKSKVTSTKRIQDLVIKYGLSHPFIRLTFHQLANTVGKNKNPPVWIKPMTKNLTDGVRMIYGTGMASMVEECSLEEKMDPQLDHESSTPLRLHCLLPCKSSDPSQIFKGERVFIYVDKRPINYTKSELKDLVIMVRKRYKQSLGIEDDGKKLPFMYIDIKTAYGDCDVNIEPDKSVVMLNGKPRILDIMQEILDQTYGSFFNNTLSSPNEKAHTRFSHTIQQVPCRSPQPNTSYSPDLLPTTPLYEINELDELDDDETDMLFMPRMNSPPLLPEWMHQQQIPDKEPSSMNVQEQTRRTDDQVCIGDMSPPPSVRRASDTHKQQRPRFTTLDWQVDDESHVGDTSPPQSTRLGASIHDQQRHRLTALDSHIDNESCAGSMSPQPSTRCVSDTRDQQQPRSTTLDWQVDDESHNGDTSPPHTSANVLSDWLAQFRRPNTAFKRQDSEETSNPLNPAQAKRPRIQIPLAFTRDRPTTIPSPDSHDSDSSLRDNSPSPTTSPYSTSTLPPLGYARHQDASNESPEPVSPTHTNQRNLAHIFTRAAAGSSKALLYSNHKDTTPSNHISTLNDIIPVNTSATLDDMKKSYTMHRNRHSQLYRKSVTDYLKLVSSPSYKTLLDQNPQSSVMLEKNIKDGIMLFAKGAYTDVGWMGKSLGVLDMKLLQQCYKFQKLMQTHELNCGKPLAVPPQIIVRNDDPVYGVIIALEKRDDYIVDDGHRSAEHTYSLITDRRVTANGFRVRWRKDPYTHDLVVQFTAIADLKGYGPSDFYELVQHLNNADLKSCRPKRVIDSFVNSARHLDSVKDISWQVMLAALDTQYPSDVAPVHYLV